MVYLFSKEGCHLIKTACPACGRKGKVPENFLEKNVTCPKCKNTFLVQSNFEKEAAEIFLQADAASSVLTDGNTPLLPKIPEAIPAPAENSLGWFGCYHRHPDQYVISTASRYPAAPG
jgi:hypothetical protein